MGATEVDTISLTRAFATGKTLVGFCLFLTQDNFTSPFFGNVLTWPLCLKVYKREVMSGLCSAHMFYFGYWLFKMAYIQLYPIILVTLVFPHLGLTDPSPTNYLHLMASALLSSMNSTSLGHAWGVIFDSEIVALMTADSLIKILAAAGGNLLKNRSKNFILRTLKFLSPLTYSFELVFNRIMHENDAKGLIAGFLRITKGDAYCAKFLLVQTLVFLVIGWAVLLYKTKYQY